jgi:hypothetical protein
MALTQLWWNSMKRTIEGRRSSPTPAMKLGLASRPLTAGEVLH